MGQLTNKKSQGTGHHGNDSHRDSCYITGKLLVSTPFITDTRFYHSVIYICGHDEKGAMGFILNKPLMDILSKDLLAQLNISYPNTIKNRPIYYGGPVEIGRGFVLHSAEYHQKATVAINEDFSITATVEILEDLAHERGPRRSLLMLGYTGWAEGHLDQELQENQWLVLEENIDFIFEEDREAMWLNAYHTLGIEPCHMSIEIGHA